MVMGCDAGWRGSVLLFKPFDFAPEPVYLNFKPHVLLPEPVALILPRFNIILHGGRRRRGLHRQWGSRWYRHRLGTSGLDCPGARAARERLHSLLGGEAATRVQEVAEAAALFLLLFPERRLFLKTSLVVGCCQDVSRQQQRHGNECGDSFHV